MNEGGCHGCHVCFSALLLLVAGGCVRGPQATIETALSEENPAHADVAVGVPPVDPAALSIVPTALAPTHTPAVAPEPIHPRMDEGYDKRQMPAPARERSPADPGGTTEGGRP